MPVSRIYSLKTVVDMKEKPEQTSSNHLMSQLHPQRQNQWQFYKTLTETLTSLHYSINCILKIKSPLQSIFIDTI